MKLKDILTEMPRVPYGDVEDDMGTHGSKWERKQKADAISAENEWRASEQVKQLAHEIKNLASQAYDTYRAPKVNYKVRTANVKIFDIPGYKFRSPAVSELNAMLDKKFKNWITIRRVGSSVLYHIPYDIFHQEQRDDETNI